MILKRGSDVADIKYADISFIIPASKEVKTVQSIPIECSVHIQKEYTQGKARNTGVLNSMTEWIAFADDDIKFNRVFLDYVLQLADKDRIIGLQGYYPSPWLISRFMFFHRSVFDDVGPLKEVRHGEETEWLIRAQKKGYKLLGLPRQSVYHFPHKKATNKHEFNNMLWLLRLHPSMVLSLFRSVVMKMLKSSDDVEYSNKKL